MWSGIGAPILGPLGHGQIMPWPWTSLELYPSRGRQELLDWSVPSDWWTQMVSEGVGVITKDFLHSSAKSLVIAWNRTAALDRIVQMKLLLTHGPHCLQKVYRGIKRDEISKAPLMEDKELIWPNMGKMLLKPTSWQFRCQIVNTSPHSLSQQIIAQQPSLRWPTYFWGRKIQRSTCRSTLKHLLIFWENKVARICSWLDDDMAAGLLEVS